MSSVTGQKLKEKGMQLSLFGAGNYWRENAEKHFMNFLNSKDHTSFMIEDVRRYAYENGFVETVNLRAWGAITSKFRRMGLINSAGYSTVKNAKAHCAVASLWVKSNVQ
jgi:hypothetical protein